jgi:hypothetical protein
MKSKDGNPFIQRLLELIPGSTPSSRLLRDILSEEDRPMAYVQMLLKELILKIHKLQPVSK